MQIWPCRPDQIKQKCLVKLVTMLKNRAVPGQSCSNPLSPLSYVQSALFGADILVLEAAWAKIPRAFPPQTCIWGLREPIDWCFRLKWSALVIEDEKNVKDRWGEADAGPALWGLYVACSHDLMMTSAAKTETCLHSLIHSKARLHHKLWHVNESSIFLFYVLSVALLLKNNTPPLVFLFSAMPLHNK